MADYKPNTPYNVAFFLLVPDGYKSIKGVRTKVFKKELEPRYCSFRSFGGTERVVNNVLVVEDTAIIETWYDPAITAGCNIQVDDLQYEILGTPENINMRGQYMRFKIRCIEGGA